MSQNLTRCSLIAAFTIFGVMIISDRCLLRPAFAIQTDAKEIYASHCAACHGIDGKARTAKGRRSGATDFTSDWDRTEARGIRIIMKGKGQMPSFKKELTGDQIRAVFGHVANFR